MAINPGAGFPFHPKFFETFITDTDPGLRFIALSRIVFLKCPTVAGAIRHYTRTEYEVASNQLAAALIIEAPLEIARTVVDWVKSSTSLQTLMSEQASFKYSPVTSSHAYSFLIFLPS